MSSAIHIRQRSAELFAFFASLTTGAALVLQPAIVLAALGASVVALLTLVPLEIFVVTALMARNIASGQSELVLTAGLNAGAVIGLLVLAVSALRIASVPRPRGLPLFLVLSIALLAWFVVGVQNFSIEPSLTREIVRSLSFVALALLAANVRSNPARDRLLMAVLLASVIPAVIAVEQMVTRGVHVRAEATFAHPNEAAALFSLSLAVALWRWLETRDSRVCAPLVFLFAVALLGTQSLGGVAQMLVTLIVYALLTRRFGTRSVLALAASIALILVFVLSPLGNQRLQELDTTTSYSVAARGGAYTTNSLDWRFYNWAREIDAWRDRPYLGYGLGSTASIVSPGGNIAHSDVLRVLVETGVIGFLLFGAAFLALCRRLYTLARGGSEDTPYAALALAVVAGLTVHGLVNNVTMQTATMYCAVVVVGCALGTSRGVRSRRF